MNIALTVLFWSGWFLLAFLPLLRPNLKPFGALAGIVIIIIGLSVFSGIPLAWPSMPFSAWATIATLLGGGISFLKFIAESNAEERRSHIRRVFAWLVTALGAIILLFNSNSELNWITGVAPLTPIVVVALAFLTYLVAWAVSVGSRLTAGNASSLRLVQVLLVLGSIVFAIPLAWMLLTSLREDQFVGDASRSPWIPTVSVKAPFDNPRDPYFEVLYGGQKVEARLERNLPNGDLALVVEHPPKFRGTTLTVSKSKAKRIPRLVPVVELVRSSTQIRGIVKDSLTDGRQRIEVLTPAEMKGAELLASPTELKPFTEFGLHWRNYSDAILSMPASSHYGWTFLRNTLILIVMSTLGTLLSSSLVAYAFARMRFPGKNMMFMILLSTMMLPGAVTMLPTFLIFRWLGWIDTLYPLWVPTFFAGAFNVFLLRQFFRTIPTELEDAARIDGCSFWKIYWQVMLPLVKPALICIGVWTFMGAWGNFMGPLIYVNTLDKMPIAYALQLYSLDKGGEPGMMMAMSTMAMLPILALFFCAQRYFIEGVTLTGLADR